MKKETNVKKNFTVNGIDFDFIIELKKYCLEANITLRQFVLNALTRELKRVTKKTKGA